MCNCDTRPQVDLCKKTIIVCHNQRKKVLSEYSIRRNIEALLRILNKGPSVMAVMPISSFGDSRSLNHSNWSIFIVNIVATATSSSTIWMVVLPAVPPVVMSTSLILVIASVISIAVSLKSFTSSSTETILCLIRYFSVTYVEASRINFTTTSLVVIMRGREHSFNLVAPRVIPSTTKDLFKVPANSSLSFPKSYTLDLSNLRACNLEVKTLDFYVLLQGCHQQILHLNSLRLPHYLLASSV